MTATNDPFRLELDDRELQDAIDQELCRIVTDVVQACSDRDYDLLQYRAQREGWSQPQTNNPWPGACTVEASISQESHLTFCSAVGSAARQHPYACVESVSAQDMEAASQQESYLNIKAQQYHFEHALKDAIFLCGEGRFSVFCTSRHQDKSITFRLNKSAGGEEYIERIEDVSDICLKFRTPDPWDVYPYPVTAYGPQISQGASLVIERMVLTQEELLMGVQNEGFDPESVQDMLRQGPCSDVGTDSDPRQDQSDRLGVKTGDNTRQGGVWYCYQIVGRMPLMPDEDGNPRIPEPLIGGDFLWMVCPQLGIRFKQAYTTHKEGKRPYVLFRAVSRPNHWQGDSPVSMISSMHEEMTSVIRFGINNMNLESSPCLVADERWKMKYAGWTVAPGRILPRMPGDQIGPKPLTWDVRSQPLVIQWLERLDSWCRRLVAAEGMGNLAAGKVRKAAEIHAAEAMQQAKFDLYLSNIQEGIVEVFDQMRDLLLEGMPETGDTAYSGGHEVSITPDILSTPVRFFSQASADRMTAAARLAKQQVVHDIVIEYWTQYPQWLQVGQATGNPLQVVGYIWQLTHRLLILADERAPERLIGPDPLREGQQQGGQQGLDPQIVSTLQAILSGGGQAPGAGGSPSPAPSGNSFGGEQMMGGGLGQAGPMGANMLNGAGA